MSLFTSTAQTKRGHSCRGDYGAIPMEQMESYAQKRNGIDTLGVAQRLEDGLVAERVLAALHHQLQLVVDALRALLLHRSKTIRKTTTRAKTLTAKWEE